MTAAARPMRASAGVVGLTTRPDTGEVCLVLGREAPHPDWAGSLCWSDFGGRARPNDARSTVTAARELHEEIAGAPLLGGDGSTEFAARRLDARDYVLRITVRRHGTRHDSLRILYVVAVPWPVVVETRETFYRRRKTLLWVRAVTARLDAICCTLRALSLPCPGHLARFGGRLCQVQEVNYVQRLPVGGFIAGLCCGDETSAAAAVVHEITLPNEAVAVAYGTAALLRGRLRAVLQTLPPDLRAAAAPPTSSWGLPRVRPEYLEKDEVQALPLAVLARATQNAPPAALRAERQRRAGVAVAAAAASPPPPPPQPAATAPPSAACAESTPLRANFVVLLKLLLKRLAQGRDKSWRS